MKDKKKAIPIYDVCFREDNKTEKRYERYFKLLKKLQMQLEEIIMYCHHLCMRC